MKFSFSVQISIVLCLLFATSFQNAGASSWEERSFPSLSTSDILALAVSPDPIKSIDPSDPNSHLSKILIPRVSGTENNTRIQQYITSTLKKLEWHIELDEFTTDTPIGPKKFANIIATKNPNAPRRVILAAHFDSKYFPPPDDHFVGATDSAAPCAMMLDLAETLDPLLSERDRRLEAQDDDEDDDIAGTTLQLVFFDGEEAFHIWSDTDSIYGARHLAEKWSSTYIPPTAKGRFIGNQETQLSGIENLVLLDLLGAPNPHIRSYFLETAWLYDVMVSAEQRLGENGAFAYGQEQSMAASHWSSFFQKRLGNDFNINYMGDDHTPFLHRGVSILHIIAEPFPHVWHSLRDDASALHIPTMRRWNLILRVFFAEYLHLRIPDKKSHREATNRSQSELVSIGQNSVFLKHSPAPH